MRRDRVLIDEMVGASQRIVDLVGDSSADDIALNLERRDAILWNFTVLGEAATSISEETRALRADTDWRGPARLRNRIVHGYWSVDLDVIVAAARHDVPVLLQELRIVATMLAALDE